MNLLDSFIEISLSDDSQFLKIKETLTRIGIAAKRENKLWQSCHILHKKGKYYIVHFKELFQLDGKQTDFTQEDMVRRNTIALLLEDWGLLKILNPATIKETMSLRTIKVVPFKEKKNWELLTKYRIGKTK